MTKQFKPLKAVNEEMSFEDVTYPKLISVKIDGVNGLNLNGTLLGRSLKKMKNEWLTEKLSKDKFQGLCGEIVNASIAENAPDELKLNRQDLCRNTTSFTGAIKKTDWDFAVVLFDYIGDGSEEYCHHVEYVDRMRDLCDKIVAMENSQEITHHTLGGLEYVEYMVDGITFLIPVPKMVHNPEEAEAYYVLSLEEGHEGIVLRCPYGIYKFGRATKKSQEIIRFKPSGDSEIIVMRFEQMFENQNEAKTNELGHTERSSHKENKVPLEMVGALVGIDIKTGEEVRIGAGRMDHAERAEVWVSRRDFVGRLAKYKFMATGIKDKPRHPRFISWRNLEDVDQAVVELANEKRVYLK